MSSEWRDRLKFILLMVALGLLFALLSNCRKFPPCPQ